MATRRQSHIRDGPIRSENVPRVDERAANLPDVRGGPVMWPETLS